MLAVFLMFVLSVTYWVPCGTFGGKKRAAVGDTADRLGPGLTVFAGVLLNQGQTVFGHEPGAGVDVVAWQYAITVVIGENDHWQISLQARLLVDTPVANSRFDTLYDFGTEVECT